MLPLQKTLVWLSTPLLGGSRPDNLVLLTPMGLCTQVHTHTKLFSERGSLYIALAVLELFL